LLVTVFNRDSGLYEVMPQSKAFVHVRQPGFTSLADSYAIAGTFRDPLTVTGQELAHDIGADFMLADNKSMGRLEEKAYENGTNGFDITDFARGSLMIGHWKQVEKLRRRTDPGQNTGIVDVAGAELVFYQDNFARPLGNGMRRMLQKYDVTNDNQQHQICEIQARVAAMKAAEDLTHKLYKMKRDFKRTADQILGTDPKLATKLYALSAHCADLIKPIHDLQAMRHGYDVLIDGEYDPATAPSAKNPVLKLLMRDAAASEQLKPLLQMVGEPKRMAKTITGFNPSMN
jgi:hypothetical protein